MKNKPSAVERLLEELEGEVIHSELEVSRGSKIIIFLNDDDDEGFELNEKECRLLLANCDTAQRLADALDQPSQASLCLFDLWPDDRVLSILERSFAAIDEG